MIEGIDYYPKQKKKKRQFKFWMMLLLLVVAAVIYWAMSKTPVDTQPVPISIVIGEPDVELPIELAPSTISQKQPKHKVPELLEQLDALALTLENKSL